MNFRKTLFLLAIIATVFASCKKDVKDQPDPNPNPSMEELVIPDDFNWETTRDLQLKVSVDASVSTSAKSKISVFRGDPASGGVYLVSGSASAGMDFITGLRIPAYLDELYLQCEFPYGGHQVTRVEVTDEVINHTFSETKTSAGFPGYKSATDLGPECTDCDLVISGNGSYNISNGDTYCVTDNFTGSITFESWNGGGTLQICGTASISNIQLTENAHIVVTQDGSLTIGNFSSWGNNGTITVYENATLIFSNSFQTQGDFVENQGTLEVQGDLTIQNLTSGNFTNSGILSVNGNVQVNGNHTLYNHGEMIVEGTSFQLNSNADCENNGTMTLGTTSDLHFQTNSNSELTNNGVFDVTGDISINAGSIIVNNCAMMCSSDFAVNSGDFHNYSGFLKGAQTFTLNQSDDIDLYDGSMISTVDLTMNSGGIKGYGSLNSVLATGTYTIHSVTFVDGAVEAATDDLVISIGGIPEHFINGATVVALDEITNYIEPNSCNPDGIGSPGITDTDGDGVPDDQDDYPEDFYRAYNSFFPGEDSYASIVFEDLWPSTGDYDFNDLVLGVFGTEVTNADNEVVEIFINFNVRAVGASLQNGFGWQYAGILPSEIQEVTGTIYRPSGESYVNVAANGIEQGQDSAVIIAVENVEDVINRVGGSMYNTLDNGLVGVSDLVEIYIYFGETTPIEREKIGPSAYNVFLIKNQDRGTEIHLSDREPTNLMTFPLGTVDDTSDPLTGRYYKTETNLPWGLLLVEPFDYPLEKIAIVDAYPQFAAWAQSGGTINQNWYLNPDPSKIWIP